MKRLVWVTRPEGQHTATAHNLEVKGFEPLIAPLLKVQQLPLPALPKGSFDGIVLTSANALPALQAWAQDKEEMLNLPVVTTGRVTADAAREAGFKSTFPIQGAAPAAFQAVPQVLGRGAASLLYPCAAKTAHSALELAEQNGLEVTAIAVYATHSVEKLPDAARSFWDEGKFRAVLLYSPRTAKAFVDVTEALPESPPILGCLSKAIAEVLPGHWQSHAIWPESPREERLLEILASKIS